MAGTLRYKSKKMHLCNLLTPKIVGYNTLKVHVIKVYHPSDSFIPLSLRVQDGKRYSTTSNNSLLRKRVLFETFRLEREGKK